MFMLHTPAEECKYGHHHPAPNPEWDKIKAAREAAGRIIKNPRPYRVSRAKPCPICGKPDYCCCDRENGVVLCSRISNGALTDYSGQKIEIGEFGHLHLCGAGSLYISGQPVQPRKQPAKQSPARLAQNQRLYVDFAKSHLLEAGEELRIPAPALKAYGFGRMGKNWTWPERTADGNICGFGYRQADGGRKSFMAGGNRGIILQEAHVADFSKLRADIIAGGRVILPEGFTCSAAGFAMGEVCIGRPNVSGGITELAELINHLELPAEIEIDLHGENDQKSDGTWPGRDRAAAAARKLSDLTGRRVNVIMPPPGVKDLREGWQSGYTSWESYISKATILDNLPIPCGLVADICSCPDSSLQEQNTVVKNWDKLDNPQGISNESARCPNIRVSRRIVDKYKTNPWDCPSCFGAGGEKHHSPVLLPITCHKWNCPVCGPYRRLQTFERFHHHLLAYSGQLYFDSIPDFDWPAIRKSMRRRAEKLGVPFRYVALRDESENLTIFASVHVRDDLAKPIEKDDALELLEIAVDGIVGPRPFTACRAWGVIEKDKETEVERVPGGCSPAAFNATVEAWGGEVEHRGRFIECVENGLFIEGGVFSQQARDDFWYEAAVRGYDGNERGDEVHAHLARFRAENPPSPPPTPPQPTAGECRHPEIIETPTFDPQYFNRKCGVCGQDLYRRKVGEVVA